MRISDWSSDVCSSDLRALDDGDIVRISRGLYQDPQSDVDSEQTLAEVAKRIPKGVIAMVSALAYHGLTDQMPRKTWVAIGASDWSPVSDYPPVRIVRFAEKYLHQGVERHAISGVDVPVFSVAKTLADLFRNGRLADRSVAVEGLRSEENTSELQSLMRISYAVFCLI